MDENFSLKKFFAYGVYGILGLYFFVWFFWEVTTFRYIYKEGTGFGLTIGMSKVEAFSKLSETLRDQDVRATAFGVSKKEKDSNANIPYQKNYGPLKFTEEDKREYLKYNSWKLTWEEILIHAYFLQFENEKLIYFQRSRTPFSK
ncbi:hypothetical protein LQ236_000802 [Nitrospina gracilis]|nr:MULTISPECIES: hypothetical protein [Nitrospina]MCF8722782.1 hypothetical protein [Nitrospina sp. Nb-3]